MSVARRTSSQLLSSRSVHLRIQPRPANLSESREIYRVLQRFGDISTYKYLRYEYHNPADNIALAIYRDADSAQQALNASPIRFALERVHPEDDGVHGESHLSSNDIRDDTVTPQTPANDDIEDILRPSRLINRTLPDTLPSTQTKREAEPPMPFETPTQPQQISSKWFQVTVDRSRVVHQDYVERQPYWKQFSPMKSMAQEDLAKVVPHVGLSDVSKRPPHAHRTPNKVLKMMADYVENRMPSLKEMYEESGKVKS